MALALNRQIHYLETCDYTMFEREYNDGPGEGDADSVTFTYTPQLSGSLECIDVQPFEPALPPELVLLIFEAGAASSKRDAATLSLVSRAARAASLPLLFRTLILQKRKYAYAVAQFLSKHPHIAVHVRAVWMRESTGADSTLLSSCPRVQDVAVLPACLAQFCALGELKLREQPCAASATAKTCTSRQLVLFPGYCDWLDFDVNAPFTKTYFSNLTHLWLTQPTQLQALIRRRRVISTMTNLQHLAVPWYGNSNIPSNIFNLLPSLRSLVVIVLPKPPSGSTHHAYRGDEGRSESVGFPLDKRIRLYAFLDDSTENSVFPLWKEHCFGGRSIWDVAVKIIRPS